MLVRFRIIHSLAITVALASLAGLAGCGGDDGATPEACGTPGDEDGDGHADCADSDCAGFPACEPVCGNGRVDTGEQCDDGNDVDTDACTSACMNARCGDGFTGPGEQCDDSNTVDTDACTNACQNARCGDGVTGPGEQCDDGNQTDTDACTNACMNARCGDGITGPGEQCDDANQSNTDACTNACQTMRCGDGFAQPGEMCDDGNMVDDDACTNMCTVPSCGDGVLQPSRGEQCDDGNMNNNDACLNTCLTARCGDGVVRAGSETCDDADNDSGDGCSATCAVENGYACAMEPSQCATVCGDGIIAGAEQCDQGGNNVMNGDGCSATCMIEANWTCTGTPSVCDTCGNGVVGPNEQCDDGNTVSVDGCSAQCRLEASEAEPNEDGTPSVGGSGITGNDFDTGGLAIMNAHAQGTVLASAGSTARIAKIDPVGDEDIFEIRNDTASAFELRLDTWNRAPMYGVNVPCGTSIDTGLTVKLADGTTVTSNDDRNGAVDRCSGVLVTLPAGATVYAWVVDYGDDEVINTPGYGLQIQFIPVVCGDNHKVVGVEECDDGNLTAGDGCSATCTVDIQCPAGQTAVVVNNTTPAAIPDNDSVTGVSSAVNVPTTGAITAMKVFLTSITHTNDADLDIYLDAPTGQRRELSTDNGSTGDNYLNTLLADTATTSITSGSAPFSGGPYKPEFSMASTIGTDFARQNAHGAWTLRVFDDLAANTGSLNAWRLMMCVDQTSGYCGDAAVNGTEECDDGNLNNADACTNLCQITDGCGDGNLDPGEACDDDNVVSGDGCSAMCQPEITCAAGLMPVVVSNSTQTAIPDNDQVTGVSSTVAVANAGAIVTAKVYIGGVLHTNDADLDLYLVAPNGLQRELSTDNGSTGDNYYNTTLDDTATAAVTGGTAPFNGRFRPEQSLTSTISTDLIRTPSMGTWTLRVFDDSSTVAGGGTLQSWSLLACVDPANGYCGDGVVNGGEECDDGNNSNADNCTTTCAIVDGCGDGNIDAGELCDDNNVASGDGCSSTCQPDISCAAGQMAVVVTNSNATAIPDNQYAGIASPIAVATAGLVRKVILTVNVTHAKDDQIDLWLMSPYGAMRDISTDNGSSTGVNYRGTIFRDTATTAITSGTAPFTGAFKPEQTLDVYNDQAAQGDWVLRVADDTLNDTGTLDSWTVALCVDPVATHLCGNGVVEAGESCDDGNTMVGDGCSDTCAMELNCPAGQMAVIVTSADAKAPIPDSTPAGITSGIMVTAAGNVSKAVVGIGSIGHTWDADLDISLIAPNATIVDVSSDNGSSGMNYLATELADAATALASSASAPLRGYYKPDAPLAPVAGQPATGTWTLGVVDDLGGDAGVFRRWTIGLCVAP